jgi:hypothetical protein
MQVAIMQPYFFPYLGHFGLLAQADMWVVFDLSQYTPKTWLNRNRVLHPKSGWMYIGLPLSNSSQSIAIHEARVLDLKSAHRTLHGKLSHYKNKAPFFREVTGIVEATFALVKDASLVHYDVAALRAVCEYLGLGFNHKICSEMGLDLPPVDHPGAWAPLIAQAVGATVYLNPISGRALFRPRDFRERDVELKFFDLPDLVYGTGPYKFEPGLSILDVLMWNEPSAVVEHIRSATPLAWGLAPPDPGTDD